jgi:lipopolysaccharide export system ATP-binding protein
MTTGETDLNALEAHRIRKRFGTRVVVKDVSLSIRQGEVVGLLGPNGAGKTTCFYMIAGLIKADQGSIHLGKQVITQAPMDARARLGLGYLPQEPSIFRKLSVRDNILAILETVTDLEPHERLSKTDALINEFKLDHVASALGMALSGGERRRAEIARALACEPRFLLLDEPFAGVDPISVGDIKAMIRQLAARGIGVLITDHNVRETLDICQRAYIVNDGSLIAEGSAADILGHEVVKSVYLGDDFRL